MYEYVLIYDMLLKTCQYGKSNLKSMHSSFIIMFLLMYDMLFSFISGFYPHSSVGSVPGVAVVQREVAYCPEVKFCGFDIALYRAGQDRGW